MIEPKHLLIVKVPAGLVILNKPSPRGKGAIEISPAVPVGTTLEAYRIVKVGGVPYAWLAPNPPIILKPPYRTAWCRVQDADFEYVDVIDIETDKDNDIAAALREIAGALRNR